ncbi:SET domain-containing protein [Parathielavia appendiculata]|uniref:SET domain-containing protein n=1 Tax=Parathielavia appendiculata TaxID=2587402 RepID=A0AAN6UA22_9PEZI|nr:SET domain-containing protein [Parathielavia appendiculata]
MQTFPLIIGLFVAGLTNAFQENIEKATSCSRSPLVREAQLVCSAPQAKRQRQTSFKDDTPGLWKKSDQRYQPPSDYKLPPSWKGPEKCFQEFCLFSNPNFGEGMSLITTSRIAYLASKAPVTSISGLQPTAYYEAEVPGKGAGLFANRTIHRGEIIFQRHPVLAIQSTPHLDLDPRVREELYQAAIDRLPQETRARFLRQVGTTMYDKAEKNAFRIFLDGSRKHSPHLGLFPEVSKINHDCRPNIHYRITDFTHTTVAVRDIHPGEELTVSYIYGKTLHADRQKQLHEWGFNCTCSQCTLPPLEIGASDNRIRQIKALENEIETLMAHPGGKGVKPEMGGKLVELYVAERLDAYLAPTYTRAALLYSMFGSEERARVFATEAMAALEREVGPQAKDIESMRRLAEDPKGHWSWGIKVTSGTGASEVGRNETRRSGK